MTTFAAIEFQELKMHQSFSTIDEMDNSIYSYIEHIRKEVPQSVIDVLLCLGRASLRCVGISFMKQTTIANITGYSRKTINKALKTLEALGVVDSVRTKTKSGRPSVKITRILSFCLEGYNKRLHLM
jgi:biotin operon repressor